MADWDNPIDAETDPDAPLTSNLGKRFDNNVIALAEGASGAPKIAIKTMIGSAANGSFDFTGLGDFSGIRFDIHFYNSSSTVSRNVSMSFSDDGLVFGIPVVLTPLSLNSRGSISMAADFATGDYEGAYHDFSPGAFSGTVTGSSLSVVAIRLTADADLSISVFAQPNGGASAS